MTASTAFSAFAGMMWNMLATRKTWLVSACQGCQQERRKEVPLDSIVLSDPCILADRKTAMYYMTGTGGMLWKSKDLKLWEGPFHVAKTDSGSLNVFPTHIQSGLIQCHLEL